MPPVHRQWHDGTALIDVRLLEQIEALVMIDQEPSPSVVAPLIARVEAERDAWRNPEANDELVADTHKALDPYGSFLNLTEIHCVQQLRGWNRARYGKIAVSAGHLSQVRNLLDSLTLGLENECKQEQREWDYLWEPETYVKIAGNIARDGYCGFCNWCTALRLRDEVDAILDAQGFNGGSRYRAYCLNETERTA